MVAPALRLVIGDGAQLGTGALGGHRGPRDFVYPDAVALLCVVCALPVAVEQQQDSLETHRDRALTDRTTGARLAGAAF